MVTTVTIDWLLMWQVVRGLVLVVVAGYVLVTVVDWARGRL